MTRTVSGGLYQVSLCEAGSWMVLELEEIIVVVVADYGWDEMGMVMLIELLDDVYCNIYEDKCFY